MFQDNHHNGCLVRPVFYNGKRWDQVMIQRHLVAAGGQLVIEREQRTAAVFADNRQRYPRVWGVTLRNILAGR